MTTTTPLTLYIRRAEVFHNEDYIREVFQNLNIGIVSQVTFIKKSSEQGKPYNGVLVTFEKLFESTTVAYIFQQMAENSDHTARIVHNNEYQRYWVINQHISAEKPVFTLNSYDPMAIQAQPDELYALLQNMAMELQQMHLKLDAANKKNIDNEYQRLRDNLTISDLQYELKERDDEMTEMKHCFEQELSNQQDRSVCLAINLAQKESECDKLKEQINEEQSILRHVEAQANEMRAMLYMSEYRPNTSKMTIEELID